MLLLRLLLITIPLVALVLWLRQRARATESEEELQAELATLKRRLLILLAGFIVVLSAWFAVDTGGPAGDCYIPPRTVDGKVQPGQFVPFDDPRCAEDAKRRAAEN